MAEELSLAEKKVLVALGELGTATPGQVAERTGQSSVEVMNASSWLRAKGLLVRDEKLRTFYGLGPEGKAYTDRELPERRLAEALLHGGGAVALDKFASLPEFQANPDEVKIATGQAKRKGLIEIARGEAGPEARLTERGRGVAEGEIMPDERVLEQLAQGEQAEDALDTGALRALLDRQNVVKKRESVAYTLQLSPKGQVMVAQGVVLEEGLAQLTPELLQTGKWRDAKLRPYDVTTYAPEVTGGKKHPLRRVIDDIRAIFLEMGFEELEGPFVHTAFWDMDVLFVPQDHPAREMQDTFYLQEPATRALPSQGQEAKLVKTIRDIHERGGKTGSRGWGYQWSPAEAERLLLRTHTTVETIARLARAQDPEEPVKAFIVGRVFRKEAMDATHLPEFTQVDGIVMEPKANLRMLIGLLREFYAKMGATDVRVRPAYFPYTEPSLEVEVFYNNKWIELGGAGIFRPEVTRPLGLKHPVLAWGLGLERLAMMKLGLKDIRQLYESDLDWLRRVPAQL
ncbi:MAG TPA: phenylalanine--tRNA ligase subunit alpha [Candidatus Thermoplasmatota archaeon]|nr:phenylalanine--tRNA ligase subunit alpha [Candidatus Thermoplasmatota archaeon]